jgi:hypothetical protein
VREFLFTEKEIDEDWENHLKITNLKHILKPVASVVSSLTMEETASPGRETDKVQNLLKSQVPSGIHN